MQWDSDFTRLSLDWFHVIDQNDTNPVADAGEDEPVLHVTLDGTDLASVDLKEIDEGETKYLPPDYQHLTFRGTADLQVIEIDSADPDDDFGTRQILPPIGDATGYLDWKASGEYQLKYHVHRAIDL